MKTASVTEAKNGLSALLGLVRKGTPVLILDRNVPVARLEPIGDREAWTEGRLQALERDGMIRLPKRRLNLAVFEGDNFTAGAAGVLDALIEERRDGR